MTDGDDDAAALGAAAEAVLATPRAAEAEPLLRRAMEADPVSPAAAARLARLLLRQGRLAETAALLREIADRHPHDLRHAVAQRDLGIMLHMAGRWEEARPFLERAAALEPWDHGLRDALERAALPPHLAPEVTDPLTGRTLRRAAPRESRVPIYVIDIAGTCNLRCPSCPVGNSPPEGRSAGLMPRELFEAVVAKILREAPCPGAQVNLFSWGEPLLHPELPDFIRLLRANGLRAHLSTNLNIRRGLEAVVAAGPEELKVSLSGITPAGYGVTHARGDIGLVLGNLRALRRHIDAHGVSTRVWVGHHLYRGREAETAAVRALCEGLGFEHHPIPAYLMPLERVMDVLDGRPAAAVLPLLPLLPNPPVPGARGPADGGFDCELRSNQTVINHDGSLALCCAVWDRANMLGLDFVDTPAAAIEAAKYRHPFCAGCIARGLHAAPPAALAT